MTPYLLLIAVVALERLAELVVSKRNAKIMKGAGAIEYGASHYPAMVALHIALLIGAPLEVALLDRPFVPWLGWTMLTLVVAAQILRWWCITTLGPQWNTRILVAPGLPLVDRGPYALMRHPNYLAVVVEGLALPLVHTAWITAGVFTLINGFVLRARIDAEDRALGSVSALALGKVLS